MRLFHPWSPLRWTRLRLVAALLAVLLLGLLAVRWAVRRHDHFLREELLRKTYIVAQAVPLDRVLALKGDRSDEERTEYRRLKTQLITAAQIEPAWEWIYLMGRNADGEVFFQMDSEAFDAEDPSPPGQVYPEASPLLHRVFETGAAATEGPLPDRWGVWVSAFVPLKDAASGRLVTVVGVDIEAGTWRLQTWRAGLVPGLLTLALMAVLLAGYALRGRPDKASGKLKHRWRHLEAALIAAIGLILTLAGVWLARGVETTHSREAFLALGHMKANHLLNAFQSIRNSEIESFGRFFENSDEVTHEEFRNYARYLNRIPEVSAWGWIPVVESGNRPAFVQRVRDWAGDGFDLWEFDRDGGRTQAPERPFHYPLLFLESSGPKATPALEPGFDLAALPELARLLDPAGRPPLPFASDPFVLTGRDADVPRIGVFRPVRSRSVPDRLQGYVMATLLPQTLLDTILNAHLDRNPLIHMELLELQQDAPPLRLASTFPPDTHPPRLSVSSPASPSLTLPILAFGRTYAVRAYPSPDFFHAHATYLAWITLFAGLVITAACTLIVRFIAHRREDLEQLVEQRASDLALMMRRYDQLSRHSRTITWELDADGRFTSASGVAREVWGRAPDDLAGRPYADLHPEEGGEAFRQQLQAAFADRRPFLNLQHPVQARSGDVLWMSANGIPLVDGQGRLLGYQGTDTDITERKRAADELARLARQNQAAVERYQALISASNTGAWEYDDQTARLWTSPEYFQMLGRDPGELASDSETSTVESAWLDLLHPDDKEPAMRRFSAYLRHPDRLYQQTFRMRHADGSWVWILSRGRALLDADGRPTPIVVGTHIDITESKRAEQALRDSEEKFRLLTENMVDVVWTLDTETLRFRYVSPSVRKLLGLSPDSLLDRSLDSILVPAQRDDLKRQIRTRAGELRAGHLDFGEFFVNAVDHLHADGHLVHTEVITRYMVNARTGRVELHGVTRDITDRKRAEQYREMGVQTLQILNEPDDLQDLLHRLVAMIKANTGCDAAGIRLQSGHQHPYVAQQGFSCRFMELEHDLDEVDDQGAPRLDADGRPVLRCACGLVLSGIPESGHPLFTPGGSCWTNDAPRQFTADAIPRLLGHCLDAGYASIALVPIRVQGRITGLLQINDRRKGQFTTETIQILESLAAHIGEAVLRKRAEQDYRTLFHEMLEGFAVHEIICDRRGVPTDYRFLAVNPAFEAMTGLKADQIVGQTVREVLPDTEPVWIETYGRVALTGEPAFFQQYAAAIRRHFEVAAFRPAPNQFACIFSDITDRKLAEEGLRESRRQYAALLANLPGMAYRCANDDDWTMEFVSEGCRELTGYAPDDLIGSRTVSFNHLVVESHRQRLRDEWQEALDRRMPFEDEYEITTRSGDIRWVWEKGEGVFDEAGNLLALEGFIADITDRKHAGIERDRLMAAIEQSGDTVVITDARGAILYVNPAFSRVTGYSREEALGQNPRILQSGVHDRDFYRQMWAVLSAGRAWQGQIINKRKDGSPYTEMASISPVRDGEGRIAYFVAVKRDITQQLLDQKEREDLQSRLVQARKMESIGRLAGGIAHDFNNMLQAILGYAEMGLEEVKEGQPLHSDLLEIQKAARRSAALTQQLQAFARKQPVRPKILDLNAAIDGMTGMLRPLLGEQIALEWVPGTGAARIQVDPSHLDQVVTNLCVNARDAVSGPGRIRIETDTVRLDRPLLNLHGDIPPGDYVRLTVADSGCGMAPGMIEHIFEPFFTTKTAGKGTGLGLATVYGILQQNHAIPRVHSRPGKGTTFQVYFPRLPDQAKPAAVGTPDDPEVLQSLRGTETILIAEDEKALLQTARRMLESLGYTVRACDTPAEALRLLETSPRAFDLLLTDVMMPDMSGPELVRQALAVRPDLPHLYMSGYAANLLAEKGVRDTGAGFLQKPFSRIQLARKIRDVLDRPPSA